MTDRRAAVCGARSSVRVVLAVGFVLLGLSGWGCRQAPRRLEALSMASPEEVTAVADEFWADRAPPVRAGSRVAVVEFALEVVTEKDESPFGRELAFLPPNPISVGVNAIGPLRQRFDFGEEFPQQLADAMYASFEAMLEERGLTVIPPARAQGAGAFKQLPATTAEEVSQLRALNLVSIDTGRIKKTTLVPAHGTKLVQGAESDVVSGERVLLGQLNADTALRVRMRVGTYAGRAAVMQGSVVTVTRAREEGQLTSRRSLVATEVEGEDVAGGAGVFGTRDVDRQLFLEGIDDVFPLYSAMLLEEMVESAAGAAAR